MPDNEAGSKGKRFAELAWVQRRHYYKQPRCMSTVSAAYVALEGATAGAASVASQLNAAMATAVAPRACTCNFSNKQSQ